MEYFIFGRNPTYVLYDYDTDLQDTAYNMK